jgi:hypothetical protein
MPDLLDQTRESIESFGYRRRDDIPRLSRKDVWYELYINDGPISHILFLEFRPTSRMYNVYAGLSAGSVREAANILFLAVEDYLPLGLVDKKFNATSRPCWSLFNAGRVLDWPGMGVPNQSDSSSPRHMIQDLVEKFLKPELWSVDSLSKINDFLFRNDLPFEWLTSNTALRSIEILAVAAACENSISDIRKKLIDKLRWIQRDTRRGMDALILIDKLIEKLHNLKA